MTQLIKKGNIIATIEGNIKNILAGERVALNFISHICMIINKDPNIKIGHSDDYSALKEVIQRRFRRWSQYKSEGLNLNEVKHIKHSTLNPINISDWPDLIMIDGGKGQLNAVLSQLKDHCLKLIYAL